MKFLQPMILKSSYFEEVEKTLNKFFDEIFYDPIREAIKKYKVKFEYRNDRDLLSEFMMRGLVDYFEGAFYGKFNSTISKQLKSYGAKFSKKKNAWLIEKGSLPEFIISTLVAVENRNKNLTTDILSLITGAEQRIKPVLQQGDLFRDYEKTTKKMNEAFNQTVKEFSIVPKFTQDQEKTLAREYNENMNIYIQNWSEENILKLRAEIMQNTLSGQRSTNLLKSIEQNYKVSRSKAKFLARQETSLLMSKIRQERFKLMGFNRYKWSGAMDQRERKDHKDLQGKIFSWDNPPIVDHKTGRRANPGEDFNCRCVAIPLAPSDEGN